MVVDSSALLAILRKEPEAARFTRAILRDSVRLISAANLLEAGIVIDNQAGPSAGWRLDAFVERARISAANLLEAGIVADNQTDPRTGRQLDALVANFRLRIEPVTEEQVRIARQAYVDFGRGNHPAGLNFGDCFAYALAKTTGEPLLSKGNDFARTDVRAHQALGS